MSKKIVIANWKMNPGSLKEGKLIIKRTEKTVSKLRSTEVVIAPPFPLISLINKGKVKAGSQDVFFEEKGAFTGEVSAALLKDLGVTYSIIGHSERRKLGETNDDVSKKVRRLLDTKITPIVCIGESERDREGKYLHFLQNQIRESLRSVKKNELKNIVIAYEPIWAIGKSAKEAMDASSLHETTLFISKVLSDFFGREYASKISIIYGGSVEAKNSKDLIEKGNVKGFLVGHASLKEEFADILKEVDRS